VQEFASTREPLFDGVLAQLQLDGDALDGLLFTVEQDERLTAGIGDPFQRAPEDRFFFAGDGLRRWRRLWRWRIMNRLECLRRVNGLAAPLAEFFADEETGDAA